MALAPRQTRFLIVFAVLLIAFYAIITINAVDKRVVLPFTAVLARISGAALKLIGERVAVTGTVIAGARFAVDIRGGCNGLEAVVFVCAAMLAFHAPLQKRILGALAAALILEALNVIRIDSLYLLGVYHRNVFEMFHLAVWQTLMFGAAVFLFLIWTSIVAPRNAPAST
ncbi:MAG TPA: exosortase H [Thermoanaerobaculia bacterium]|jgi:exosortase H (IPTLxxWG-CTERM-specific)|nr:exosortase H [Thermoanaerobaculia bacterium]